MGPSSFPPRDAPHVATSAILEALQRRSRSSSTVTLSSIMDHLQARSFGIILLLLGICALIPGISLIAGVMLLVLAFEMIRGRPSPTLPRRISEHPIASRRLVAALGFVLPGLRFMERLIHPSWFTPSAMTNYLVAGFIVLLGVLLFVPVPLSNLPVGAVIILLAFAYLEKDGALLVTAGALTIGLLGAGAGLLWETISAARWLAG